MSNVNDISHLARAVEDYQDHLKQQSRQKREADDERLRAIEETYRNDLEEQSSDMQEKIKRTRDQGGEAIEAERSRANQEIAELKQKTYDRYGRQGGGNPEELKQQLQEAEKFWAKEKEASRSRQDSTEDHYQSRLRVQNEDHARELESALRKTSAATRETIEANADKQRTAQAETAEAQKAKFEALVAAQTKLTTDQKRQFEHGAKELEADYQYQMAKKDSSQDRKLETNHRAYTERSQKDIHLLREGHARETNQMRAQMRDLVDSTREHTKGRAEGSQEAVVRYENEFRDRGKAAAQGYEKEIDNLKSQAKRSDDYSSQLFDSTIRKKEGQVAEIIARQNLEAHLREKGNLEKFEQNLNQKDIEKRKVRDYYQATIERDLDTAQRERAAALEKQAAAYQTTIANTRSVAEDRIANLERDIQRRTTSADPSLISPTAEKALRDSISEEHQKVLAADSQRFNEAFDVQQSRSRDAFDRAILSSESKINQMQKQAAEENHRTRQEISQTIESAQFEKEQTLRQLSSAHAREIGQQEKNFQSTIEAQKRHYEEIINTQRDEALGRLASARQEREFETKMLRRDFSAKYSDTVRDFERQLTDQKAQYDSRMKDLKDQTSRMARENERATKKALDEQSRSYEHRIAEMDLQLKERERYLTQNFQEELDKVRRTNAALIEKKS